MSLKDATRRTAGILLGINIVCVNLASKIAFFLKGIHPRTWLEKEKAKRAMLRYVLGWIVTLFILTALMYAQAQKASGLSF